MVELVNLPRHLDMRLSSTSKCCLQSSCLCSLVEASTAVVAMLQDPATVETVGVYPCRNEGGERFACPHLRGDSGGSYPSRDGEAEVMSPTSSPSDVCRSPPLYFCVIDMVTGICI